ncbi:MAG: S-layer homology domain-containing protein [Candidatus Gastranaerophilales bacterium]|nr:S-layer homology domain-containing protein [Candidatus Gastranaerophilales bacterium]
MTIKKLTVAAAIAVGIATCSFTSAIAACPVSGCNSSCTTPTCAPCNPCSTPCCTDACGCTTPACPTCNSCCDPCCNGCTDACNCDCPSSCKPTVPACATCPSTSCCDLDMKQVYAYPSAIYGTNNYTGEQSNAIYSTHSAWCIDHCDTLGLAQAGVMTGAACGCGSCSNGSMVHRLTTPCDCACNCMPIVTGAACGCGCETGFAVPLGSGCCGCDGGSVVDRDCCKMDCAGCPITIQTANSLEAIKKSFMPFEPKIAGTECGCGCTGAAAPLVNAFPDVPDNYWAACPIDKLAMNDVVVGYPDRLFKPGRDISRAEFATMMVKGYNLNCSGLSPKCIFKDVPKSHWANALIAKAVEEGIMCGYPDNKFKPKQPVSRVEALTAMAHGICSDIDACKAKEILSAYCDGCSVPDWAQIPVAKSLNAGALKTSLNPKTISPCCDATRAEIADMLQNARIAMGYDTNPATACACPKPADPCTPKKAYMENEEIVKIPTLKLKFLDEINAKSSNVGDQFATTTTEEVTINGKCYPCGSRVNGKIVEVIRPSGCEKGALKLAFTSIESCDGCKCDLPKQILTAQVNCSRTQNPVARLISTPFTLVGGLIGTTGRTIGGMIASAGNAAEAVSGGTGIAMGELFQAQFRASGRSLQDAGKAALKAPVDFTRTALSGATGLLQSTGDEVAYLLDPNGSKISAVNPKERITIAFGCAGQ